MTKWAQRRTTDLLVRVAGGGCCTAAYLAVGALMHLRVGATTPAGPVAYGFAALGFLCGSIGTMLVALGRHIFDRIEVSERWRHRPAPAVPQSQQGRIDADSAALGVEYSRRRPTVRRHRPPCRPPRTSRWFGANSARARIGRPTCEWRVGAERLAPPPAGREMKVRATNDPGSVRQRKPRIKGRLSLRSKQDDIDRSK